LTPFAWVRGSGFAIQISGRTFSLNPEPRTRDSLLIARLAECAQHLLRETLHLSSVRRGALFGSTQIEQTLRETRHRQREFDSGKVDATLVHEMLYLPEQHQIFRRIEPQIAVRARWNDESGTLIFP